ncbi:esterase FE4-like [Planococcus citri]|uniref:esterase FE4-like n=1 Tax=Planococcus citri TaxID=170843 RepID=UPI0031F7DD51
MSSLIVEIPQGKLQGKKSKSILNGQKYYSFLGIPYAKPPIGDLRFQAPQPSEKWEGVYDATFERDVCMQRDLLPPQAYSGSENCLFLSVDIPQLPNKVRVPKAVMVFIHGGGFSNGSASQDVYSSDYLIQHDIILVRFNFRKHVLGFLNLGLPECPGNAGLKDQTLAMKWVKENITHFGGNPDNITLFGISSGASSVHYHILSPLSKGLFEKAIIQSGSALSAWALTLDPKAEARKLGETFGFENGSDQDLLSFLKKQTAQELTSHAMEMIGNLMKENPEKGMISPFAPSVEEIKEGAFLLDLPHKLLKTPDPLPIIYGVDEKEGIMAFFIHENKIWDLLKTDFSIVLKQYFNIDCARLPEVSAKVKQLYFGDKEIGPDTADQLIDLFSDIFFYQLYEPIEFVIDSSTPPYVYEFTYSGGLNFAKHMLSAFLKLDKGACHADEQGYLFYSPKMFPNPTLEGDDLAVIQNITELWTNFAKTGKPSDESIWAPSTPNQPRYLNINCTLELEEGNVYGTRLKCLRNLLESVAKPYNT